MSLRQVLDPIVRVDPVRWKGLPPVTESGLETLFGEPKERAESVLGYYPATRCLYRLPVSGQGLVAWLRDGEAVLVETLSQPSVTVLERLPAPSAVLAQEILVPDAYAHEYLYCTVGLVLTVCEPLSGEGPDRIVRCRGLRPLADPSDFGPEYYCAFENQVRWETAL